MAELRRCFNEPRSDCRKVEEPRIQGLPFSEQHESQTSKRGGITRGQTVLESQRVRQDFINTAEIKVNAIPLLKWRNVNSYYES